MVGFLRAGPVAVFLTALEVVVVFVAAFFGADFSTDCFSVAAVAAATWPN